MAAVVVAPPDLILPAVVAAPLVLNLPAVALPGGRAASGSGGGSVGQANS